MTQATQKASAVVMAMAFHEAYERLAPSLGYETRPETRAFDPESANGKLMIAVCSEIEQAHLRELRAYRLTVENLERQLNDILSVSDEMVDAAIEAYMPFGDMRLAVESAIAAQAKQGGE